MPGERAIVRGRVSSHNLSVESPLLVAAIETVKSFRNCVDGSSFREVCARY